MSIVKPISPPLTATRYTDQAAAEAAAASLPDGRIVWAESEGTAGVVDGGVVSWSGGSGVEEFASKAAAAAAAPTLDDGVIVLDTSTGAVNVVDSGALGTWSDAANVVTVTAATWDARGDGAFEGQWLVVTDGHLAWRWKVGVGWVPAPVYALANVTLEATISKEGVRGAGWAETTASGGTVTDSVSLSGKTWCRFDTSDSASKTAYVDFEHGRTTGSWMAGLVRLASVVLASTTVGRFAFYDGSRAYNLDPTGNRASGSMRLCATTGGATVGTHLLDVTANGAEVHVAMWLQPVSSGTAQVVVYLNHRLTAIAAATDFSTDTATRFRLGDTATSGWSAIQYIRDFQAGRASA